MRKKKCGNFLWWIVKKPAKYKVPHGSYFSSSSPFSLYFYFKISFEHVRKSTFIQTKLTHSFFNIKTFIISINYVLTIHIFIHFHTTCSLWQLKTFIRDILQTTKRFVRRTYKFGVMFLLSSYLSDKNT